MGGLPSPEPGPACRPDPAVLDGAALLYCDGRNTEAAIVLATVARGRGVPVLVEGERPRPHLDELLALADVVTGRALPRRPSGHPCEPTGQMPPPPPGVVWWGVVGCGVVFFFLVVGCGVVLGLSTLFLSGKYVLPLNSLALLHLKPFCTAN